jgi:hypothetical protein
MKKCGAQNPITALDGALSCAYLDVRSTVDAWRDARCLAQVLHRRAQGNLYKLWNRPGDVLPIVPKEI